MALCPHFNTQNPIHQKSTRPWARTKKKKGIALQKKECSQENRSVPKKSFRLPLLRVRQTPFSQPRCRYCTGHTHTSGTFLCLQQLISTRRAVFLPRFPWFSVCITNFRAFLLFCCGRSMHRKPAITSTFYLLYAIGSLSPHLHASFDTNAEFIPFLCFFCAQWRMDCGAYCGCFGCFD